MEIQLRSFRNGKLNNLWPPFLHSCIMCKSFSNKSFLVVILVTATSVASASDAKISFRQLTKTHPIAVQRGTSAQVVVSSNFTLDGSHSVFFSPAGPNMKYVETEPKPVEWAEPQNQ